MGLMKYRILWSPVADENFNAVMQRSQKSLRKALLLVVRAINATLVDDPIGCSESRSDDVRIAFFDPLGIYFELMEDVRTVVVINVWRTDLR